MASLLERKLIVVTGKGGTGKTTMACALGLLGARRGLRTLVAELGEQQRLPALFGHHETPQTGAEVALEDGLWSTSIDPNRALVEWLRTLGGRISIGMFGTSNTLQYFAAAAPGAKELVSMVKVRELCERRNAHKGPDGYNLVVLDAPATGHALAMLRSPQTFAAIARVGPLADQAQGVRELLEDSRRSGYVAVAQGTEMAVSETLELEEGLRRHVDRRLDTVIVNGTLPRRFTREELNAISTATSDGSLTTLGKNALLANAAGRTASTVYERARVQQGQIARLRRQHFPDGKPPDVITAPFIFTRELDLTGVWEIARRLERIF